jgi:hypothetical protein
MASGHVNRIQRPNTWLHRPMLQNVKKALANPEPSTHGTKRTCRLLRDVRSQGQSGKQLLALSFSVFDPKRTFGLIDFWCRTSAARMTVSQFAR